MDCEADNQLDGADKGPPARKNGEEPQADSIDLLANFLSDIQTVRRLSDNIL